MIRKVAEGLWRGPRLMLQEYRQLKEIGVRRIVNLETDREAIERERLYGSYLGIVVEEFPMGEYLPCSARELAKIAWRVDELRALGVYVHCRRGIDRTGQVIAAWQIMFGGMDFEEAYARMVGMGHPEIYNVLGWRHILSKMKDCRHLV